MKIVPLLLLAVFGHLVGGFGLKHAALITFNFTVWITFYIFWVSNVFLPIIALPIVVYKCFFEGLEFRRVIYCLIAPVVWVTALLAIGFAAVFYDWSWLRWSMSHPSEAHAFWVATIGVLYQYIGSDRSKSIAEMRRMWS